MMLFVCVFVCLCAVYGLHWIEHDFHMLMKKLFIDLQDWLLWRMFDFGKLATAIQNKGKIE